MATVTKTFSDAGVSAELLLRRGESYTYAVDYSSDFDGGLFLEYSDNGGLAWVTIRAFAVGFKTDVTTTQVNDAAPGNYRFRCILGVETLTGTAAVTLSDVAEVVQSFKDQSGSDMLRIVEGGVTMPGTLAVTGAVTHAAGVRTTLGVGTAATGVTAVEYGDGKTHTTVLTISTTLPAIAGGANLAVGKLLYTLPAGAHIIESAYMSLGITQTQGNINADTPDGGLGTVIGSGVVATLDGTATFENIITGQTFNNCTGTAEVKTSIPTAGVPLVIEAGAAKTIYFNVADGWAASGDAAALLAGTVVLNWRTMA